MMVFPDFRTENWNCSDFWGKLRSVASARFVSYGVVFNGFDETGFCFLYLFFFYQFFHLHVRANQSEGQKGKRMSEKKKKIKNK